jgi:CDP-diacylglycerol---serine O-phosphatidyltransferase
MGLKKVRKTIQRKKQQSVQQIKILIPFVFTFSNALFGFFSIIKTFEGDFLSAAWFIVAAVIMDGLDGAAARYFGTTGALGGELDSLCDAISFCLAPTVLLYSWYLHDFGQAWLFLSAVGFYLCAGLFRLARFNVTEKDQSTFYFGLPTTIAAFFLIQFVFYQEWFVQGPYKVVLGPKVMVGIIVFVGLLMISSLRFPVFKKARMPKTPLTYFKVALLLGLMWWSSQYDYPFFLIMLSVYIFGAVLFNGFTGTKRRLKR